MQLSAPAKARMLLFPSGQTNQPEGGNTLVQINWSNRTKVWDTLQKTAFVSFEVRRQQMMRCRLVIRLQT